MDQVGDGLDVLLVEELVDDGLFQGANETVFVGQVQFGEEGNFKVKGGLYRGFVQAVADDSGRG